MAALAGDGSLRIPLPQRDVTLYRSLRPENFGRDAQSIQHPPSRTEIEYLLKNGILSKCDMSNIKEGLTCESVPKPECCDTTVEHHIGLNKPSLYISTSKNKYWTINYTLFNKVYKEKNQVGIFVELCLRNTKFVDFTSSLSQDLLVKSSIRKAFAISAEEVLIVKPIIPSEIKGIYMTEHVTREYILELGYDIPKMSAGTDVQLLNLDSGVEFYYISTKNKEGKFSGKYFKVTKLWGDSPKSASPKSASPKKVKSASPRRKASPRKASPKKVKSASPRKASPKKVKSASPI